MMSGVSEILEANDTAKTPTAGGHHPRRKNKWKKPSFGAQSRRRAVGAWLGRARQPAQHQFQTGGFCSGTRIRDGRNGTRALATTTTFHTTRTYHHDLPKKKGFLHSL